ncbi:MULTISPECIES: RNA methyltransferase [Thioclava]|uniref:RNA methyltransferase n=1 Tax=Thioclava TaxID=285107 RepID=UPI000B53C674|nr:MULTISPECIES: RNA methyltransferase [Thioclava]OWY04887.1 RNA methyltransferase [Thioclava sp. F1Mire-8]OWY06502.1 RNA methyltransferase [Thioclava sp. IC9]OWY09227.1 RNA methyltransferase [Thioclava sp. F42-5]OWY15265.1 RNA methyltransferase [Thioclava sp. F34-6]OWY18582.1 RNA methyltransferase [Thioclava sp. JM3]
MPHTPEIPDPAQPAFILVRPQMGENIGAAARAMLNFSLRKMRLVEPRDGWPNPKAVAMASGAAGQVLDFAGVYDSVADAVADCDYVFATTARGRELPKPIYTPEAAMDEARKRIVAGQKVGVLFGPERTGLENDDILRANAIITVPVNPEFFSLNLAQAVLLSAYEYSRHTLESVPIDPGLAGHDPASAVEVEKLGDHFEQRLEEAGFFHPPAKAPMMKRNLRNMWTRFAMTRSEVQTLHGALRQILRGRD